jgi:flagellar assembly protein FliH
MSNSAFTPVLYPKLDPDPQPGTSSAHARGYAAGFAEGLRRAAEEERLAESVRQAELRAFIADGEARLARVIAALGGAVSQLNARLAPVIDDVDAVLVEAALELAEAVLQREVQEGHVTTADTLRRALALVPDEQTVTVRMSPVDLETLGDINTANIVVTADAAISSGDAIATMPHGWLDVRLFAALQRAKSVLTGVQS